MPYIAKKLRVNTNPAIPDLYNNDLATKVEDLIDYMTEHYSEIEIDGVCNYVITRIVAGAMRPSAGWRYHILLRAYGTFLAAAAEFYRRLVAPYEDKAIAKNGDIPEYYEAT